MDLINNLIFTALHPIAPKNYGPIDYDLMNLPDWVNLDLIQMDGFYSFHRTVVEKFCSLDDSDYIDLAIQKHWSDMVLGRNYTLSTGTVVSAFKPGSSLIPPYHLIYAYLVENTRISQIFEKLIFLMMHDEKLGKPTPVPFQWIVNTENLFFKDLPASSYRNIRSMVRLYPDATRRNAYFRLFGMDLAFGDIETNGPVNFFKAQFNNQPFIVLFESFLSEIWQAYTNVKNEVGPNTTDMFHIVDTAQKIREMLMSRRTNESTFDNYRYFNLSKEEYAAVVMMSWLFEIISYNSPVVTFLGCDGNTPGERLHNIGKKVGIPAHSKSEGLLDIAPPMNTLLRRIELGDYSRETTVTDIITSQSKSLPQGDPNRNALNDLLLIINNWEKATGHKIKNPQSVLNGTVKIDKKMLTPSMS